MRSTRSAPLLIKPARRLASEIRPSPSRSCRSSSLTSQEPPTTTSAALGRRGGLRGRGDQDGTAGRARCGGSDHLARPRANGLFVGSGVVEAGCKSVIGQRLKLSGMRWTEPGVTGSSRCAATKPATAGTRSASAPQPDASRRPHFMGELILLPTKIGAHPQLAKSDGAGRHRTPTGRCLGRPVRSSSIPTSRAAGSSRRRMALLAVRLAGCCGDGCARLSTATVAAWCVACGRG